jgi:thiamine kinase-like enzyme
MICHNDVCLENVVFRDGEAVALLDFDFAAPGRPLFDLAAFARMCVPIDDDLSASRRGFEDLGAWVRTSQ